MGDVAVDLFTGAGAIASVIAARNPGARVVAADVDPVAVDCARRNGERYGFEVVESDVDAGLPADLEGRVDVLTANVPYVPSGELPYVPREGEPVAALDGGPDGLDWTRRLVAVAPRWLRPGGWLLREIGGAQEDAVRALLAGWDDVAVDGQVVSARRRT
jgi:release factor glutamine methyltransferase